MLLALVKNQITIITNTQLQNAYPGTHDTANSAFLSAAFSKHTKNSNYFLNTTVDQIAAKEIDRQTQLTSLELTINLNPLTNIYNNNYTYIYQNCLSWSSPTTPLPSEAHPRVVFETLFGEGGGKAERRAALPRRASLLDFVKDDLPRPRRELRPAGRSKVGQDLEAARGVERR